MFFNVSNQPFCRGIWRVVEFGKIFRSWAQSSSWASWDPPQLSFFARSLSSDVCSNKSRSRLALGRLVLRVNLEMIVEILAGAGQVAAAIHCDRFELSRVPAARLEQQLRRVDRSRARNHFSAIYFNLFSYSTRLWSEEQKDFWRNIFFLIKIDLIVTPNDPKNLNLTFNVIIITGIYYVKMSSSKFMNWMKWCFKFASYCNNDQKRVKKSNFVQFNLRSTMFAR